MENSAQAKAKQTIDLLRARMQYDVMGRNDVIELVLVALLGDGHVLLEDFPGSGKTTLAKALGGSIDVKGTHDDMHAFRRMQFTPDLLPSDITGVMVFDTDSNRFHFRRGPIFTHVALVDEINRTSPKVQSALLEAMGEKQVTIDNETYGLSSLFFVIATQNPLDAVGTYPLPIAQLDRFMFKIRMTHISREDELSVIKSWGKPRERCQMPMVSVSDIVQARDWIRAQVAVDDAIMDCLVDVIRHIRGDGRCIQGASTRSLVQAVPALQSYAFMQGRMYVTSQDVADLALPLFVHRLQLAPGSGKADDLVKEAVQGPIRELSKRMMRG
ncbi:MAG: AAA family ATPase [Proteobacteria bacterium]|nr:AAA family ATPase [Pseudomonadota bacterium]